MKLDEDELYIKIVAIHVIYDYLVEKILIKIVAIHAIYDYLVEKILIWNHLVSQNIVLSSHISKF